MNKKKVSLILIGIIICAIVLIILIDPFKKNEEEEVNQNPTEITPAEEMTEEQERQTIISLYYINTETNTLIPEARVIDAKNLLENPYKMLVEAIIGAPKNEKLKSAIGERN